MTVDDNHDDDHHNTNQHHVVIQFTDLPFFLIAPFLEGTDILSMRLVNSMVKFSLVDSYSEVIWSCLLERDFQYSGRKSLRIFHQPPLFARTSVFGTLCASDAIMEVSSAFEAWMQWKRATHHYLTRTTTTRGRHEEQPWSPPSHFRLCAPYFLRSAEIWARLEQLLARQPVQSKSQLSSSCSVQCTLLRGKGYRDLDWHEDQLQNPKLHALQALLAFYGGQLMNTMGNGIFGGFSVHEYRTCTSFMEPRGNNGNILRFAACPLSAKNGILKYFYVDAHTGHVMCNAMSAPRACRTEEEYAVLDWMDEYVRRLETGYYQVGPYRATGHSSISLFPQKEEVVRTVRRGIEVVISSLYSPWTEHILASSFVYSIRLRLLTPGEAGYMDATQRGFHSCQLQSRHWRLMKRTDHNTMEVEHVDADGVLGNYPLLRENSYENYEGPSSSEIRLLRRTSTSKQEGTFVFQSCTDGSTQRFGGHLLFVPGSLANPTGDPFEVPVGPLILDNNPDFLY